MANQPTIVVASLDTAQLEKSINAIVKTVEEKTNAMAQNFTTKIGEMQQALNNLGLKGSGGSSGTSKQVSEMKDLEVQTKKTTEAVKEQKATLDQMAQAQKKAIDVTHPTVRPETAEKSARDSYLAFMQGYKQQGEAIAQQIREAEEALNRAVSKRVEDLTAKLALAQEKLRGLESHLQYAVGHQNTANPYDNPDLKRTQQQIEYTKARIAELNKEIANAPNMFQGQAQQIEQLRQKHEQVANAMKDESAAQQKVTEALAGTNKEEGELTRSEKERAEAQKKASQEAIARIEQEKAAIKERGLAAQQTANALRLAMQDQQAENMLTGTPKAIAGVRELHDAIEAMRRTYLRMTEEERQSPVGKSLERDIQLAKEAQTQYERYNRSLIGLTERDPLANKTKLDTYNMLSGRIKQLTKEYHSLTTAERESEKGKGIADKIQLFGRAVQQIQQQMNRPISLESVLGFTPKTLDDMTYKMQRLNLYKQGIDLTKPESATEIKKVDAALEKLQKDMDRYMVKGKQVSETNNILGRSWTYMKNRLAFYFTVGASTAFVKNLIEVRSQYEMNEKALGILIDSAERGSAIFKELSEMALVSPYTLIELSNAARQLTAYDIAAKDVVDTTRRLADMTAAVGIPIERLTYAIGQVKAYGYLNARDARMFSNAGIPLVKQLAEYYTELEGRLVSTADVYDKIKKKTIEYNDVMAVVNRMTDEGGKFFDYQAKMADTLKVQLANLALAWNNMLNDIGQSEQWFLSGGIKGLKELFLQWKNIEKAMYSVAIAVGFVKAVQISYLIWGGKVEKSLAVQAVLGEKAAHAFDGLGKSIAKLIGNPWTWATVGAVMITELIWSLVEAENKIKKINKTIVDAANERLESINKTVTELRKLYTFEEDSQGKAVSVIGINDEDAKKAWEMIREEIENTSSSSKEFIVELERIDNVNKRVAKGFNYLRDIQKAQAALSQLDVKDIDVEQELNGWYDFYWLQDGLVKNFRDMQKEAGLTKKDFKDTIEEIIRWYNTPRFLTSNPIGDWIGSWGGTEQEKYLKDLETTVDSIIKTMEKYNVEGNRVQQEFLATALEKSLQSTDLTEKEKLKIRIDAQEMFYQKEVQRRKEAIARETGDYKKAMQQELDEFIASYQQRNAYVTGFESWLQKTQISNLQETFGKMSDEEIKHLDFSKGKWKKWAEDNANKFAEQNNLAIDNVFSNLREYLSQDFVVYIRTVLQKTEVSDVQKDFMARTGFLPTSSQYSEYAKESKSQVEIVKKLQDAQAKKAEEVAQAEKAGGEYAKENLETLKNENEELITMIHSYKAKTKEEENAEKSRNKGGNKKDPVLDSLKDEVRLVEKLQSDYDKLTKSNASQSEALATIRAAYGKTINQLNAQLRGYGLPELTTQLITGKDPNKALEYFKNTLNTMVEKGMLNLERSKELEGVIEKFTLSAKTYNLEKITKGLNSELDKLKEDYELALELDANPELGSVFMDLFDTDPNTLPQNIDQYAARVTDALNKALKEDFKEDLQLSSIFLSDDQMKELEEKSLAGELSTGAFNAIKKKYDEIKKLRQGNAKDTLKKTQDLQYKLADVNGKIAIEEEKLQNLIMKGYMATTEEERKLIDLQVQEQKKAIDELRGQALALLPEYEKVFGAAADHSASVARRLQLDLKRVYDAAEYDSAKKQYRLQGKDGTVTFLSEERYTKERNKLNKELQKSASVYKKIKDAFKGGEDGEKDFTKGLELIGDEAKKAADGLRTVAEIVSELGGNENDVENINDIANSLEGLGTAAQGYAKIQSGDVIGGVSDMIKGTWQAVSTWMDNSDKKISKQIQESEMLVKGLESAYNRLEKAMQDAYGYGEVATKRAVALNKELQLAELERQLALEQSRKKKKQDKQRIMDLQNQIIELRNEIHNSVNEIVNDLMGISSVSDAAETLVSSMIDAFKQGEDYMKVYADTFEDMIDNMIVKAIASKVIGSKIEEMWNLVESQSTKRADKAKYSASIPSTQKMLEDLGYSGITAKNIRDYNNMYFNNIRSASTFEEVISAYEKSIAAATKNGQMNFADMLQKQLDVVLDEYAKEAMITPADVAQARDYKEQSMEGLSDIMEAMLASFGITFGQDSEKNLSALQQGIAGITEDTAGAIEAYLNGISQQVYLHSDLLTQIRDAVVAIDYDVQTGIQTQMLFQLQQQYQVQMAIQGILTGVLNPSGRAFNVEMV